MSKVEQNNNIEQVSFVTDINKHQNYLTQMYNCNPYIGCSFVNNSTHFVWITVYVCVPTFRLFFVT